jgi:hypothetical protein
MNLSRRLEPEFNDVSEMIPQWLIDVHNNYLHDPDAQSLLTKVAIDPSAVPNFTLTDSLLRYKGRIWGERPSSPTSIAGRPSYFASRRLFSHSGHIHSFETSFCLEAYESSCTRVRAQLPDMFAS